MTTEKAINNLKNILTEEKANLEAEQKELLEKLWADNITKTENSRLEAIEARLEEIWLVMEYTEKVEF